MVSRCREDPARASLEAATSRKQGEGRERKGGAEVIACRVPHVDIK